MAVHPKIVERARILSRTVSPICIAVGLVAYSFVPLSYRDLVIAFCGGLLAGTFLLLWIIYQQKVQTPDESRGMSMPVDSEEVERTKRLSRIVTPIFIAAGLAAFKLVPPAYKDVVIAFDAGFVTGFFLMAGILYLEQQKVQPPGKP